MRYLSVCSGIEAATVAWHPLGWTPVAFSEIEPFPAAVLDHHYPDVPNYGDMTKHKEWPLGPGSVDLLVGGTPCQSFSVAGLRKGISDPRGGLMLTYLEIAQRLRPQWIVWENVPGVLSSGGGRDFGSFLGALGELGYGWAYRVLDAQWVRTQRHPRAVPQRRRRVFVVGCLGDWERAAAVLFERESVQRDSSPRRAQGQGSASDAKAGVGAGCYWDGSDCANTLTRKGSDDRMPDKDRLFEVLQPVGYRWQNDRDGLVEDGTAPDCRASAGSSGFHEMNHPVVLARDNAAHAAVAFAQNQVGEIRTSNVSGTINTNSNASGRNTPMAAVAFDWQKGNDVNNPRPSTMNVAVEHSQTIGTTRTPAVAFTPGNLARGAGPSPNAEVAPTMKCSAGRGADDQRTCVAHAFYSTGGTHGVNQQPEVSPAVKVGSGLGIPSPPAVAFTDAGQGQRIRPTDQSSETLRATKRGPYSDYYQAMTVRRLTPRECERLQAFPDDYTLIPWRRKSADDCPDGPRYKALGNSMAVNCMAWIGERIAAVEARND